MAQHALPLVLAADDDPFALDLLAEHLRGWGYRVVCVQKKTALLEELARETPSVLLLDLRFGEYDGVELLPQLLARHPGLVVIVLTGHGSIESAVTAIKQGAYDYLTKPTKWERLRLSVQHGVEKHALNERIRHLEQHVHDQEVQEIWGEGDAVKKLRELITSLGPTDATVLIQGESGTGKELVARWLHQQGRRRSAPFVPVNVAALPRELVESTLFGHERGAFTGADQPQIGCCEAAHCGTLFLDEIAEMDLALQSKLLRFLQDRTVQRVGASRSRQVDVRVLAATNRDLRELVAVGKFREDLFYRLNVVPLTVPPLRARREDIPLLAARFLQRFARKYDRDDDPPLHLTRAAQQALVAHHWPGNVRQLENLMERLVILTRSAAIDVDMLPPEYVGSMARPAGEQTDSPDAAATLPDLVADTATIDQAERQAIFDALARTRGNVREAARLLGRGQATVYRKLKRYGIVLENLGRAPSEPGPAPGSS